ncbi:hypothetical protein [Desulfosarcina alkanivorans]|uniref:hypothetical protein n=1 Tax=Desulfosarcina alkanivorans TaxID=571177 RepID=UPI00142E97EB|nr:hypothetical protein [Desulfosarcina alkanivorans]
MNRDHTQNTGFTQLPPTYSVCMVRMSEAVSSVFCTVSFRMSVSVHQNLKRLEDFITLQKKYRSHAISKGTLDIDDLLFNCFGFACNNVAVDPSDIEILISLEQRMAGMVYYRDPECTREKRMKLLTEGIFSMLERISPKGSFFGIHPGDPGRVGFWPDSLRFQP